MPVHVRKRGDRFKSATFPHFFDSASAAKVPRTVLDLLCVLPSRKTTSTAALNLTGDIDLAFSMFMATIDTLFSPALHRKGNATVTFVALGNTTVTFDRVTYSKLLVGPAGSQYPPITVLDLFAGIATNNDAMPLSR